MKYDLIAIKVRKLFYALPKEERPSLLADLYFHLDAAGRDEFLSETDNN